MLALAMDIWCWYQPYVQKMLCKDFLPILDLESKG